LILWSTPSPFERGPSPSSPGPPSTIWTCGLHCPSWYLCHRRPGLCCRLAPMTGRGLRSQARRLYFLSLQNHWKILKRVLECNCCPNKGCTPTRRAITLRAVREWYQCTDDKGEVMK
jgi:hypothetical protein